VTSRRSPAAALLAFQICGSMMAGAGAEPAIPELFWHAAIEGTSPNDVASQFGVSPAADRQAKSRILRRLKLILGEASDRAGPA
jgi:hypothetical protein